MSALPEHEAQARLQSIEPGSLNVFSILGHGRFTSATLPCPIKQIAIPVPPCQTDEQLAKSFVQ
jgi:hypothetical protein